MTMQPKSPPTSSESAATHDMQDERLRALERAIATAERRLQKLDASIENSRSRQQLLAQQVRRIGLLLSEQVTFLQVMPSDGLDKLLQGVEQPAAAERVEHPPKTTAKPSAASRSAAKKSRSTQKKPASKHFGSSTRQRRGSKR